MLRILCFALVLAGFMAPQSNADQSCDDSSYEEAISQIAEGNQASFESMLRHCIEISRDAKALYLLGLAPRYFEIKAASPETYHAYVVEAAEAGFPLAQSYIGQELLDLDLGNPRGPRYIRAAAVSGDEWATLYKLRLAIRNKESSEPQIVDTLKNAAVTGFPAAFAAIVVEETNAAGGMSHLDEQSRARQYQLLARGMLLGDPVGLVMTKDPARNKTPVAAAIDLLTMGGFSEDAETAELIETSYPIWQKLHATLDEEDLSRVTYDAATKFCVQDELDDVKRKYCEIRAGFDHYICKRPRLEPGVTSSDRDEFRKDLLWKLSFGYTQCRRNQLTQRPGVIYYSVGVEPNKPK